MRRTGIRRTARPSGGAGYMPGANWMHCDLCGLRYRAHEMRRQPHGLHEGLWVCPQDFEAYNPQFKDVRAVEERIAPRKVNPEPAITTIPTNTEDGFPFDWVYGGLGFVLGGYDGSQKITADDL